MKKFLYAGTTKWLAGLLLLLSLGAGIYFGIWVMSAVYSGGTEVLSEAVPDDYFDSRVCLDRLAEAVNVDIRNEFANQVYEEYIGTPMKTAMEVSYYEQPEDDVAAAGGNGSEIYDASWYDYVGIPRTYTYKRLAELKPDTAADTEQNENGPDMFQNQGAGKSNVYVQVAQNKLIDIIKRYGKMFDRFSMDEYEAEEGCLFGPAELSAYMGGSGDDTAEQNMPVATTEIVSDMPVATTEVSANLPSYHVYVAEVQGSRWEYFDGTGQVRCSRFGDLDTGENWLFYNQEALNLWVERYDRTPDTCMETAFLAVPVYYFDTLVSYYVAEYNTYMSYCKAVANARLGKMNYRYEVQCDNGKVSWSNTQEGEDITKGNVLVWSCDLNSRQTAGTLAEENAQYLSERMFSMDSFYNYSVETPDGEVYQLNDYLTSQEAKIIIAVLGNMEYNDFLSSGLEEFEKNKDLYRHARAYLVYSVLLLFLALSLFVYLCLVVGYQDNQNTLTNMPVSLRVHTELILGLPAALLSMEYLAGEMLFGGREVEKWFGTREDFLIFFLILMCCSALPFWFELLTRIRHRMFLKKSLCARLVRFLWNGALRLYKAAARSFKERSVKLRTEGSNLFSAFRIDRRLSAAFLGSQIALFILVLIGGEGMDSGSSVGICAFILAFVIESVVLKLVFRDIRYTAEIIDGVARLEEGDLDYKISTGHMHGHKKALAENINHLQNGLKLAVEQSLKDERLKTELITNVSHDIKTPLTSIINYVDLLKKEPMAGENSEHYLEVLDQKSQRLKQLMEDLVEVSKSSTGNVEFVPMRIDLIELLRQTLGEFEDKFKSRKLTVIENFKIDCAVVNLDSRHTFRVFENLCQNIYKYAMENSRIYVDVTEKAAAVSVVMKNISQYELNISAEELMERFVRGDESRNTSGSGLGLSIAKNLVMLQQGIFEVTLDGDLFKVTVIFPLADAEDKLAETADAQVDTGTERQMSVEGRDGEQPGKKPGIITELKKMLGRSTDKK